ncbi:hypothetical protein ABMA27_011649, partial [Loxostege sticticalis]
MRAPLKYFLILIFSICCYIGNRNLYIISENFNCLAITVHEIQPGDRRTDRQRSLMNRVSFYLLG